MTGEKVREIQRIAMMTDVTSLNTKISSGPDGDADTELGDLVPDPTPGLEELAIADDRREILLRVLDKCLTSKENFVILNRFGFHDDPMTLEEVAQSYGITRERVRQIEARALRKIKLKLANMHIGADDI